MIFEISQKSKKKSTQKCILGLFCIYFEHFQTKKEKKINKSNLTPFWITTHLGTKQITMKSKNEQKDRLQTSACVSLLVSHESTKQPQPRLTSQFGMGYGAFEVV